MAGAWERVGEQELAVCLLVGLFLVQLQYERKDHACNTLF